jgi:hypothetical protein
MNEAAGRAIREIFASTGRQGKQPFDGGCT